MCKHNALQLVFETTTKPPSQSAGMQPTSPARFYNLELFITRDNDQYKREKHNDKYRVAPRSQSQMDQMHRSKKQSTYQFWKIVYPFKNSESVFGQSRKRNLNQSPGEYLFTDVGRQPYENDCLEKRQFSHNSTFFPRKRRFYQC